MKKISYGLGFAAAASALILLGAGCGGASVSVAPTTGGTGGTTGGTVSAQGDARPATAPDDLPSLPGARNFVWGGFNGGGNMMFEMSSNDFKSICDQEFDLMTKQGWTKSLTKNDSIKPDMILRHFDKPGFTATAACLDRTEEGSTDYIVRVALVKTKN